METKGSIKGFVVPADERDLATICVKEWYPAEVVEGLQAEVKRLRGVILRDSPRETEGNRSLRMMTSAVWNYLQKVSPWTVSNDMQWGDEIITGIDLLLQRAKEAEIEVERLKDINSIRRDDISVLQQRVEDDTAEIKRLEGQLENKDAEIERLKGMIGSDPFRFLQEQAKRAEKAEAKLQKIADMVTEETVLAKGKSVDFLGFAKRVLNELELYNKAGGGVR